MQVLCRADCGSELKNIIKETCLAMSDYNVGSYVGLQYFPLAFYFIN